MFITLTLKDKPHPSNPPNNNDGYRFECNGDTNAYIAFSSEL